MNTDRDYISDLKQCYSDQAEHFHHTRKKFWPELEYLIADIGEYRKENNMDYVPVSLVDCGSGSGRLSEILSERCAPLRYVGVDNAEGMIDRAKKEYPAHTFYCASMQDYFVGSEQESLDIVVALASFQHIKGQKEQQQTLLSIYRSLKWGGKLILVNWSYSSRFLKKYRDICLRATGRSIVSSSWERNDLLIPRKDKNYANNGKRYDRMYHMFTLHELKKLAVMSAFVIEKAGYVLQDGSFSQASSDRKNSRNTYVVLKKGLN